MSRNAVAGLSSGAPLEANLERRREKRAHGLDRLLAEQAGAPVMAILRLGSWRRLACAQRIIVASSHLARLDDASFDKHIQAVRSRLRADGPRGIALFDGLALVCEVSRRCLGKEPYPVQVLAAGELIRGRIVEMATGEGKSLTAALAAALVCSCGVPTDIFTVNEYLARRDAELMRPFFNRLNLEVAAVDGPPQSSQRQAAYTADVVYVVNKDYVFDYLRHRQTDVKRALADRGLFFAIVDEADSILIDEAKTPLILARERPPDADTGMDRILELARSMTAGDDYKISKHERKVELREPGRVLLQQWIERQGERRADPIQVLEERTEQALSALHLYHLDRDYVLRNGKIQIVDEYTGRILEDRTWQRGLHQFIELKECVTPTVARETIASLTYPKFFRKYLRMAGMSGTVAESAGELRRNYGAQVVLVKTHRPVRRKHFGPFVFDCSDRRWAAVVDAAMTGVGEGRAVLIGTRSVEASEAIAKRLTDVGADHVVLNARNDATEAAIIAAAGTSQRITVATNMAGRGTDIVIDDAVRAAGGLLVILTEFHETTRVDRQLFGRCARQGDPGLAVGIASLEDELFVKYLNSVVLSGARRLARSLPREQPLPHWVARGLVYLAQRRASSFLRVDRDANLASDDALHDQIGFAGERA